MDVPRRQADVDPADCPKLKQSFTIPAQVEVGKPDWRVRGWIGTAAAPNALNHEEAGPMNALVVCRSWAVDRRKHPGQAALRPRARELCGWIGRGGLPRRQGPGRHRDQRPAATRRRRPRYEALGTFLRETLLKIQDQWNDLRNKARGEQALIENPALKDWLQTLPEAQRPVAQRTLGLIRGVELQDENARKDLYPIRGLAFERLRLTAATHLLSELPR